MESCRWCGAPVSGQEKNCPNCGTRLRRTSTNCRHCKRQIRSGLAVCPLCGEDLLARRAPWKLVGALGGLGLVAVAGYLALSFAPLPFQVPFLATVPPATPTEVILPPTPTDTATPRPPTATPTRRRTSTPVITETATPEGSPTRTVTATVAITPTFTAEVADTPTASPAPTEAASATATEVTGYSYAAPQLLRPADGSDFSYGTPIELAWEPVGAVGKNQWYEVSVSYTRRDGNRHTESNWRKETRFEVPPGWYDNIMGGEREVYWTVTVKSGVSGTDEGRAISLPSETWMFRWL